MTEDLSAFMTDLTLDLEEEEINVEDLNDIETNKANINKHVEIKVDKM